MIDDIACVIMAGGKSSRMGEDKALLPFGTYDTLTQFQLQKFKPHFKDVHISCKNKEKFDFEASFIEDDLAYEDSAPFIGLISALKAVDSDNIFVISVDVPFFDIEHFEKLLDHKSTDAVVAKSKDGVQPLCAIYKKDIILVLEDLIKEKKYRFSDLYSKIDLKFVDFVDDSIFENLNTPQQYQKALKRI